MDDLISAAEEDINDDASASYQFVPRDGLSSVGESPRQLYFHGMAGDENVWDGVNDAPAVAHVDSRLKLSIDRDQANLLPPLHPYLSDRKTIGETPRFRVAPSHRYILMLSRLATEGSSGEKIEIPVMLYRLQAEADGISAKEFAHEYASVESHEFVAHVLEVRTHHRAENDKETAENNYDKGNYWVFDDPSNYHVADFWRALLPAGTKDGDPQARAEWRARHAIDLPEAAGAIERVFGPYRVDNI